MIVSLCLDMNTETDMAEGASEWYGYKVRMRAACIEDADSFSEKRLLKRKVRKTYKQRGLHSFVSTLWICIRDRLDVDQRRSEFVSPHSFAVKH
jgi:hypothetical protein